MHPGEEVPHPGKESWDNIVSKKIEELQFLAWLRRILAWTQVLLKNMHPGRDSPHPGKESWDIVVSNAIEI